MKTDVLYIRVSVELKNRLRELTEQSGLSLNRVTEHVLWEGLSQIEGIELVTVRKWAKEGL
jgi:predicted site-specific integrase-resolvase